MRQVCRIAFQILVGSVEVVVSRCGVLIFSFV